MGEYTPDQVAERAGVDPDFVDRLIAFGLLSPDDRSTFSASDVRRVRIIQSLDAGGLPLAGIAEAVRRGDISLDFVDQAAYERFASLGTITFAELSATTGVPHELLVVIRESMGFARPGPDDRVRDDELAVVSLVQLQLAEGFRPAVVERALRVAGESLRRIAQTESDWFRSEVLMPLFAAGTSGADINAATARLNEKLVKVSDPALLAMYHSQQSTAWVKNIFEGFEGALARAGLHSRLDKPPAICFLDLTGYTRLTDERGDEAAADLAERLARLVRRTSTQHGGTPVKWLGDGVMFHFREPGPGVRAALDMVAGASDAGLPPAHVGLHAGPVLLQEGDYFGRTVNVASRIAEYARQGEVLVSQDVVDASVVEGVTFVEIGPVELKGLSGAIRLHVARSAT